MVNSNLTGADFEQQVHHVLQALANKFPQRVHAERQPRLKLQNDEVVVPDFDLLVVLPHERQFYFVECQARTGYSKAILHKIQHIRSKSWRQTFLFVYPDSIPDELRRALETENILHFSLAEFCTYIANISATLEGLSFVRTRERTDPGLIVRAYASIKYMAPLSVALEYFEKFDEQTQENFRWTSPLYGQKDRGMLGGG